MGLLVVACLRYSMTLEFRFTHFWDFSFLKTCLVDYNGDYIGIWIVIRRNTRCCNVIPITIHLFGDNTRIEPLNQIVFITLE